MENGAPVYGETTVPATEPPQGKRAHCSVCTVVHLGLWRLLLKTLQLVSLQA